MLDRVRRAQVVTSRELADRVVQVLLANLVMRSFIAALQQRLKRLDAIRGGLAPDVGADVVSDGLVREFRAVSLVAQGTSSDARNIARKCLPNRGTP